MGGIERFTVTNENRAVEIGFDRQLMLPPDAATVRMAQIGRRLLETSRTAERIYGHGYDSSLGRAVDLGSGPGVIASTLVGSVNALFCVDNDPHALEYGRRNLHQVTEALGHATDLHFIEGSWHDDTTWRSLPKSGLFISNPPYLVEGEEVRPGYEQTPKEHIYVETTNELVATYVKILSESLKKLPMWGSVMIRLPKNNNDVDSWPEMLRDATLPIIENIDDSDFMFRSEYTDQLGERPLHFLYAQRLPRGYEFTETLADPFVIEVQQGRVSSRRRIANPDRPQQVNTYKAYSYNLDSPSTS